MQICIHMQIHACILFFYKFQNFLGEKNVVAICFFCQQLSAFPLGDHVFSPLAVCSHAVYPGTFGLIHKCH